MIYGDRANTDSMVQYGAKVLSITVYLSTVNTLFVIDYPLPFISLLLVPFLFSLTVRSLITYIFVRKAFATDICLSFCQLFLCARVTYCGQLWTTRSLLPTPERERSELRRVSH